MAKTGVILINTGSPADPGPRSVRRYLREFLSDPRVVDIPALLRWLLLELVILPTRPRSSARAYAKIWTPSGSPLVAGSEQLCASIAQELGDEHRVSYAMRYGQPTIASALAELASCPELKVVPLYPQYASSSWGSAVAETLRQIASKWQVPSVQVAPPFFAEDFYIEACARSLARTLSESHWEHVLFSYHGLPQRHVAKSGCLSPASESSCTRKEARRFCYRSQCFHTSRKIAERLHLRPDQYSLSFQSRLGRNPWIRPYTDEHLATLRARKLKHLVVTCPSFVVDCLETLEEIAIRAKEQWHSLGGESLSYAEAPNNEGRWVKGIAAWIRS